MPFTASCAPLPLRPCASYAAVAGPCPTADGTTAEPAGPRGSPRRLNARDPTFAWSFEPAPAYSGTTMRARLVSRLVTFVVAGALVLSLAVPARAQIDPMTLSLIISGAQL